MSKEDKNPNGHKPPAELHFERSPVKCSRCRQNFEYFIFEVIDNLVQLRCGDALIPSIRMVCMHCGQVFDWHIREKDLEQMAVAYGELAKKIPYVPE